MICPTRLAKYFLLRDWTTQITLNWLTEFKFARMPFLEAEGAEIEASAKNSTDMPRELSYSITSSARARREGGIVRPISPR